MLVLHSIIIHDWLAKVFEKYNLFKEDGVEIPSSRANIDRLPLGKIGFYVYYFLAGLSVPPSAFFRQVIEAYKNHICQRKSNSMPKLICFKLLCHASLVMPNVAMMRRE